MKLETLKLTDLRPADYNPRIITEEEFNGLKESLTTFGQQENLIVNKDMTLISGHQRYEAMKALGWVEAVCNLVDLDKHQEKKLNVLMNSQAISGKYDDLMLSEILEELKLDDDYESLRLDKLEPLDLSSVEIEEDEPPEVSSEPPVSKLGEIYQLGRHRVMCGSSTEASDVSKLFDTATIAFTSPPYNASRRPMLSERKKGVKDKVNFYEEYDDNNDDWAKLITMFYQLEQEKTDYQFINVQFLANNKRDLLRFIAAERDRFVDVAFWKKNQVAPAMAENVMNSQVECIFIFSRKDDASRAVATANFRGTVSNYIETNNAGAENKNADIHGATMPVALASHFVTNFTKPGDSVYDAFIGTGTTLIACEQTDRTCYGMELDPKYVDVIRKRYAKFIGKEEEWQSVTQLVDQQ